jgi:hypothetical protein
MIEPQSCLKTVNYAAGLSKPLCMQAKQVMARQHNTNLPSGRDQGKDTPLAVKCHMQIPLGKM